jgi:ATP-dependent helicase/nuclease subunit A
VRWLEGADLEIKRDMDHSGDEVRVMTVHGAKGLEANIVFLPDTTHTPDRNKVPALLFDDGEAAAQVPVWRLRKEYEGSATRRLNDAFVQRMQQEENRLLYVAMTRARDRLYVCGHSNKAGKVAESCWYQLVANVLKQDTYAMADAEGMPARWRIAGDQSNIGEDKPLDDSDRIVAESPPDWLVAQPVPEQARVRPLVASRLATPGADGAVGKEAIASPLQPDNQDRFKRGNLIHRLLQLLPELDAGERRAAARRYLAQPGHELAPAQIEAIAGEVLAVMDNPDFAKVFATGSRAEVAVTARLQTAHGPAVLSGQIDRLAVCNDEVVIVDYKTNRPPPQSIKGADPAYIHQLAAYRAALMAIYPGRVVRAGLLWTNTAVFMEVPEEMMEQAVPAASAIT